MIRARSIIRDHTFRVKGWRHAFVQWSITNAERAEMDLSKLADIPTLDIRGCNGA